MKSGWLAALAFAATLDAASAQSVQQSGNVTHGHIPVWITGGVIGDGGSASNSPISSIGVTNNGGSALCVNSALPTSAGWNSLCLGASTNAAAVISLQNYGTAPAENITFNINGNPQGIPTVTPLPVVVGTAVCFSTTGGGLTPCGPIPTPTLLNPTIDTSITWDYSAALVGTQSVANPAATAPLNSFIMTFQGSTSGGTTAVHIIPASGPLVGNTTTEVVTGATLGQAFGQNYGRWSYSNFANTQTGIVGEYGGTVTPPAYLLQMGIENPPSTFTVYGYWKAVTVDGGAEDVQVGAVQFGQNQPNPGTQQNRLVLLKNSIGAPGTRNSDAILWEGKANNGSEAAVWWHQFVNVTSNAGASLFAWESNLNGAGYVRQMTLSSTGVLNMTTGFQIGGAAASGNVLRGNGTNFVASALGVADLSGLGTGVATALGVNVGTAGAFVVQGGALGSPSSAGTIPAFTLGGTVAGGGNQINNVVIGTTTPLAGLFTTLSASTSVTSPLIIGGSATSSSLTLQSTSGAGATDQILFQTASQVNRLKMLSSGFTILGDSTSPTPGYPLVIYQSSVSGNALMQFINGTTGSTAASGAYFGIVGADPTFRVVQQGAAGISFTTNGALALTLTQTPRLGFITNSPSYDFSFDGQSARQIGMERNTTANTAGNGMIHSAGGATSGATNKAGGNLTLLPGVSTGSGTSNVVVQAYPGSAGATADNTATTVASFASGATTLTGTLNVSAIANVATTSSLCYNTGTGLITYDGTLGTCTVSDERLKNIEGRIDGALEKLLQIDGVYYTWKNESLGTGRQIGVGAQTVERVFPELVQTDGNGRKSADYQRLTAPIIEAIRELKADNDNMRAQIHALRRK
jgi:Chaperone of endosialidase